MIRAMAISSASTRRSTFGDALRVYSEAVRRQDARATHGLETGRRNRRKASAARVANRSRIEWLIAFDLGASRAARAVRPPPFALLAVPTSCRPTAPEEIAPSLTERSRSVAGGGCIRRRITARARPYRRDSARCAACSSPVALSARSAPPQSRRLARRSRRGGGGSRRPVRTRGPRAPRRCAPSARSTAGSSGFMRRANRRSRDNASAVWSTG
jgi:hypothetical protein